MHKRILIPIYFGLGNGVLLTPFIRTLKRNCPDCEIHLIGDNLWGVNEIFVGDSDISGVHTEIPPLKFDIFINPFLGGKASLVLPIRLRNPRMRIIDNSLAFRAGIPHAVLRLVTGVKRVPINASIHEANAHLQLLKLFFNIAEEKWDKFTSIATNVVNAGLHSVSHLKLQNYSVIQLGAANALKSPRTWGVEGWSDVISALRSKGESIVLVGDANERDLGEKIIARHGASGITNLIGKTTIQQLIGVLASAKLVLGADSGIAHIGAALGRPTIVLWGASKFEKSHQLGPTVRFVSAHRFCSPCEGPESLGLLSGEEARERCPYDVACMREIAPEMVLRAVAEFL